MDKGRLSSTGETMWKGFSLLPGWAAMVLAMGAARDGWGQY